MDHSSQIVAMSDAYVEKTQGDLKDYAVRVRDGRGLLAELRDWGSVYSPRIQCDVNSLIEAMPQQTGEQFIHAVAAHYRKPRITSVLQEMADAGVRLQAGLYGVDQPDTATIRHGLGYMKNIFAQHSQPDALLTALEYAVTTQRQPMRLPMRPVPQARTAHSKMERIVRHKPAECGGGRASLADQLAARFGKEGASR